jgi:hypothetical protein
MGPALVISTEDRARADRFQALLASRLQSYGVESLWGNVQVAVSVLTRPESLDRRTPGSQAGGHRDLERALADRAVSNLFASSGLSGGGADVAQSTGLRVSRTHTGVPAFRKTETGTVHWAIAAGIKSHERWLGVGVDAEWTLRKSHPRLAEKLWSATEHVIAQELTPLQGWVIKEALFKSTPGNQGLLISDFQLRELKHASQAGDWAGTAVLNPEKLLKLSTESSFWKWDWLLLKLEDELYVGLVVCTRGSD